MSAVTAATVYTKAGTYTATATGYSGALTLEVSFTASEITAIEIIEHNETAIISEVTDHLETIGFEGAFDIVGNDIVETNSFDADTVSSAILN